jgi:HlyD family secretion protein
MGPLKVSVAAARKVEAPNTVTLVGTVRASRVSRIASDVEGLVDEMTVREGDNVKKGDAICRLNADTIRWSLEEARAKRNALRAIHEELVAGTRREDLDALAAAVAEAQADLDRWKFEVHRVEGLTAGSASNPKELNDAHAEFAIARERLAAAKAAYDKGVAGPRPFGIAKAEHDLAAQEALVKRLERDLEKTTLRAPFSGSVVQRFVELGEWVGSGDAVVELAELSTVLVHVDAPESAYPFLVVGDPARVMIDALKRSFEGHVKHVIPRATANARTIPVEIEVDNADGVLADGMFARAIVRSGPDRTIVAVPKDAVVERNGTFYIATVQPDAKGGMTGVLRPVTVGVGAEDWIAITSANVDPGTAVIIRGTERMAPFPIPVQIVDELGRPAALPKSPDATEATTKVQPPNREGA